jgi:predicted nucleic acid-binding protein
LKRFVLDCSTTIAWVMEDEQSSYSDDVFQELLDAEAVVPGLWWLEVANALVMAERRKRLTADETTAILAKLSAWPIVCDDAEPGQTAEDVVSLARKHNLTAYDAAYLELALRRKVDLATLDVSLREAAVKAGVRVLQR